MPGIAFRAPLFNRIIPMDVAAKPPTAPSAQPEPTWSVLEMRYVAPAKKEAIAALPTNEAVDFARRKAKPPIPATTAADDIAR